jgi:hypothetical protein
MQRSMTDHLTAGDSATLGAMAEARRLRSRWPPKWHLGGSGYPTTLGFNNLTIGNHRGSANREEPLEILKKVNAALNPWPSYPARTTANSTLSFLHLGDV